MSAAERGIGHTPDLLEYVERVTASRAFGGSTSLPRLLLYLAERAVAEPGQAIKEFRIANEALGRSAGFDSRSDSVVRVTTARLRSKLEEYYADEGANDPVRLQIPKGSYQLLTRPAAEPSPSSEAPRPESKTVGISLLLAASLFCLAVGYFLGYGAGPPRRVDADPELARFWSAFEDGPGGARVVYSNVPHLVTSYGRVLPNAGNAKQDPNDPDDWHTGVGEVQAVHRLAGVANSLDLNFDLKRALLVDWDEVVDVDVVYLGGPGANPQVADLGASANFQFEQAPAEGGATQYVIRNRSPAPGERPVYKSDLPLTKDYGIIRLTPGFRSDRWTLLLAGITTFGTAAAAEIVSEPDALREIRLALGQDLEDPVSPFECLIEVGVKDSVPFENRVKTCRPLPI